jgi:transcriptional regulator with XRE-family HTH domain
MITGDHVRMIRGALRLSVRQFAEMAGMSKMTVSEIERGVRRVHAATLEKIRTAFAPYVEFIEPVEGVRGAGIIMKWGVQPIGDASDEGAERGTGKSGECLDAQAWDFDFAATPTDPDFPPLPITDEMHEEVREMLKTVDISPLGRAILTRDFRL